MHTTRVIVWLALAVLTIAFARLRRE